MPKTQRRVWKTLIDYTCDNCGKGKMRPTGVVLLSYPPLYPHVCNKCGAEKTFRHTKYPFVAYVDESGKIVKRL